MEINEKSGYPQPNWERVVRVVEMFEKWNDDEPDLTLSEICLAFGQIVSKAAFRASEGIQEVDFYPLGDAK